MQTFQAQVAGFVLKYKERMEAVAKDATQSVIDDAQIPLAKGGRMHVDTGFLRASGQASLNGMPSGPSQNTGTASGLEPPDATLVIGQLQLGDSLFFAWSANYAKYREAHDGFLGLAVQKWQQYVDAAVAKVKAAIK